MKIGLIGFGYWGGGFVARNIARVADLAVIADPDPIRMQEAAATWGAWGTRVVSEPEVAIRECDAVWIATPAATHAEWVRMALANGCHVLCEKPFVLHEKEAEELVEWAAEGDLVLMVGHLSLYTGRHEAARQIQTPRVIRAVRRTALMSLSDESVLWGLGPHDVAAIYDLLGHPEGYMCRGTRHRVGARLEYPDAVATLEVDWLAQERQLSFQVNGHELGATPDAVEPLLAQALDFVRLCSEGQDRGPKRDEAIAVTAITAAIEQIRAAVEGGFITSR